MHVDKVYREGNVVVAIRSNDPLHRSMDVQIGIDRGTHVEVLLQNGSWKKVSEGVIPDDPEDSFLRIPYDLVGIIGRALTGEGPTTEASVTGLRKALEQEHERVNRFIEYLTR